MKFAYGILTHTPPWVFALLAYLVWQGIRARRPRTTTIWRALIVPAVFIIWGISRIGLRQDSIWPLAAWIAAAMALLPVGVKLWIAVQPFERIKAFSDSLSASQTPVPWLPVA
jgi:hypothetical protein